MAIFTVTNLSSYGSGSFRQAILDSNSSPGADIINFDNSLSGGRIGAPYSLGNDLTIEGLGADKLTIVGLDTYNYTTNVFINNFTITGIVNNGRQLEINNSIITGDRNGISNSGTLTVNNSIITGNGAGIRNFGNLTVNNSIISGNQGAGISSFGNGEEINVNNSSITGNAGAGIEIERGRASINNSIISSNGDDGIDGIEAFIDVTNTTISDNQGDGIESFGGVKILNSTISGNTGNGIREGGFEVNAINSTISSNGGVGIIFSARYYDNSTTLKNSTITGNTDGGILIFAGSPAEGRVNLSNTIIANSVNGSDCTLVGEFIERTIINNLIEDGSCEASLSGDPNLGPLQNNGGPTQTHALLPGSIAINAGLNGAIPPSITTDQRGFPRIFGSNVDIGSYEAVPEPLTLLGAATAAMIGTAFKRQLGKKHQRKEKDR